MHHDQNGQPTSDEPIVQADRSRLSEVLDNLLENAINYSLDGGAIAMGIRPLVESLSGQIKVNQGTTRDAQPAEQRMTEIRVDESGVGLPPGQLGLIFDRFHRVDTRLTCAVNGLRLAIRKQIVEVHGDRSCKHEPLAD